MANTNTPIFAVGIYSQIEPAIASGKLTYPSYVFCTDTNTFVFVDSNLQMQNVKGYGQGVYDSLDDAPILNLYGETGDTIVLDSLEDGNYSVSGQYKITDSGTTYITSKKALFLVDSDADTGDKYIAKIGAKEIIVYTVDAETGDVTSAAYANSITKVSQLENDAGYLTADDLSSIDSTTINSLFAE